MARINLLPWRQEVRERKNKEFMTLVVGVILLSLLGAFAAWSYFNNQLTDQQAANEHIKEENASLDKALTEIESLEQQRNEIIARLKVIQDLQGRRPVPVRVWDDIARVIPAQMYLTQMKREGDLITFTGQARDNVVVANFIRALDSTEWLQDSAALSLEESTLGASADANNATRTPYPEDKFITFVVTTKISQNIASTVASTASAVSSVDTPVQVVSASTTASTAIVTTNASSTDAVNASQPNASTPTTASTASTAKE